MCEQPLPEWATGTTDGTWQVGAQMRTRDGRRTGNGVIVAMDGDFDIEACRITIITDYGNKLVYTPGEVMSSFYHTEWIMDLTKHMGVKKYNDEHPDDRYGKVLDFGVSISGNTISLNWSPITQPNDECPYTHVTAETMFGRFLLTWKGWKEQPLAGASFDETPWGYEPAVDQWDTLEEALVWATMEFVKRIAAGGLS